MDVARTSMMHAAAPHFLWPFAVRYAAHQLKPSPPGLSACDVPSLVVDGEGWRCVCVPCLGISGVCPRLVCGQAVPSRAAPCVFLGFPTDAPQGGSFTTPPLVVFCPPRTSRSKRVSPLLPSLPYRTPSLPPPPDFLVPVPPPVDPLPPQVPAPSGVSQVDAVDPVEVTGDSGAAAGAEPGGADSGGAVRGGAEPGGATAGGAGPEGATAEGAEPGGAEPGGCCAWRSCARWFAIAAGGVLLSLEVLLELELELLRPSRGAGAAGPGAAGPAGPPGAGAAEGAGAEPTAVGPAAGGVGGAGAVDEGAGAVPAASGAAARPRPYFVPLLQQVLGLSPPVEGPPPVQSQSLLEPSSPLPAPSPYTGPTGGLAERREPASRPASPSSLPALADPESDSLRAASPTVTRLLATVVTDPSFESTAASALVAELVDFAACCRLDYAASLVAESASVCPPSVGGECALGTDVLEDRQEELQCLVAASPHLASVLLAPEGDPDALDIPTPRSYAEAVEGPYSSQWQAAMDAEMASWKSTGTYVDAVPPPGANIVSGMWIFRVKRPPGSPPVFKARYVARGFSQRQGVDYFQTFSPTPKMTTLRVLLHIAAQRDYELHSLDFSTAFLQVYGLRQAPREWHDTLRTTLAALGFAPSTADPSLFLRTDTSLPPFYILVYVDDLVFATADTTGLADVKSELLKRHTCTDLGELRSYLGLQITRDRARRTITLTQSHMVQQVLQHFGFTYILASGHILCLLATHSQLCLRMSPCEAEIYAGAMAAQELRWLTYLLTDLGEPPRSPPVLYVDNKAMLALCREQRLEHRTKHIALRYFLARELQQRGQLRLAYVASEANTADVFTKALAPCDHQRFCTQLGLVPVLPHLLSS
ncbi:unnamed protein product [Closterium sp. NIES-64]|nr:unnamed protein product [Closterium sp. NIES-64]